MADTVILLWVAFVSGAPVASAASGDWPTYLFNNSRTGFNSTEATISTANAANLKQRWTSQAPDTITSQPVIVNNTIYWGSWDGYENATDTLGNSIWRRYVGQSAPKKCSDPPAAGVTSTPIVTATNTNLTVYVGGGNDQFYSLNGINGAVNWSTTLGSLPNNFIWSSPALYNGSIYIGNSSFGDCPLTQGQLLQLNASSGMIQNKFSTVRNGCVGGGVWGSPTIDEATGTVYFATGNSVPHASKSCVSPYTEAVIELNASNLSVVGSYQVRSSDTSDFDFGSTPTLFQANGRNMVGVVNKDGIFYALQRDALNFGTSWRKTIGSGGAEPQGGSADISPAAWDGQYLYVASGNTSIPATVVPSNCPGSLRKLNPADGSFAWETCLQDGPVLGAVTVANGVAYVGEGSHLVAIDTSLGNILFDSGDTGSPIWGAPSVSNGVVYVGNQGGTLYAFGL
jgi:polyvinyl alcohol dehydrogenase (cytochrome)